MPNPVLMPLLTVMLLLILTLKAAQMGCLLLCLEFLVLLVHFVLVRG